MHVACLDVGDSACKCPLEPVHRTHDFIVLYPFAIYTSLFLPMCLQLLHLFLSLSLTTFAYDVFEAWGNMDAPLKSEAWESIWDHLYV